MEVFEVSVYDGKKARKDLGKLVEKGILKDVGVKHD